MTLTRWLEKGVFDLIRRVVTLCNLCAICRRFGIKGGINGYIDLVSRKRRMINKFQ